MFPLLSSLWYWWTTVWRTPTLRSGPSHYPDAFVDCFDMSSNNIILGSLVTQALLVGSTETECTKWILSVQSGEAWLVYFSSGLRRPISCLDDGGQHLSGHSCLHPDLHGIPDHSVQTFILAINCIVLSDKNWEINTQFFSSSPG